MKEISQYPLGYTLNLGFSSSVEDASVFGTDGSGRYRFAFGISKRKWHREPHFYSKCWGDC